MFTKCTVLALTLLLTACRTQSPRPVEIEADDMCAFCKMAISEKRYAVEAIGRGGEVYKFDNPSCMTRFIAERHLQSEILAFFAADYSTRRWIDPRAAGIVKSSDIPSPMASGLAIFESHESAQAFAHDRHGRVIRFEELWTLAR